MLKDELPAASEGLDGRDIIMGAFTSEESSLLKYMDEDSFDFDDF